jgi:hypothetical protein
MSITTVEVPRETWPEYFKDISRLYQGWSATVELLAGELGDQRAADGLPFQGLSYEYKGGSQAGDILVEVGEAGMPFETHLIHRPKAVRAAPTQPGAETDIEIESEDGVTTILRLRTPAALPPPPGKRR